MSTEPNHPMNRRPLLIFAFFCWATAGLGLSRLLYEAFFPNLLLVGTPLGAAVLAAICGFSGAAFSSPPFQTANLTRQRLRHPYRWWLDAILLVNLIWLVDPAVDLVRSTIFFFGSLWLVFFLRPISAQQAERVLNPTSNTQHPTPIPFHLIPYTLLPIAILYLVTLGRTVGRADTFEFQVVAPQLGIVHPTGYPLYLILGKIWTLLPAGSTAFRLNLGTAVYALFACLLLFLLLYQLLQIWRLPLAIRAAAAAFGTFLLAISPTFWSQAVEAEVYSLHNLFVTAILLLLLRVFNSEKPPPRWLLWAGVLGGLGLTNHLTTVFMAPPILLTWLLTRKGGDWHFSKIWREWTAAGAAFFAPLLLYAYLPLRWQAVNGEPMGFSRFIDWVIGGRFQDALQWAAWVRDPVRYEVIGQLFLDEWPIWLIGFAVFGALALLARRWQVGLTLLLVWLGFTFYCLNYYVPDLSVFLLPAHVIIAIWAAVGAAALLAIVQNVWIYRFPGPLMLAVLLMLPLLWLTADRFSEANAAPDDGRTAWGLGVLQQDLASNGAILADSDKHPPLYYLQQAEGIRPDLDIAVLPDEAAYRQQLDQRIAAGETVYLARFLPNLAGLYHLNSAGPLTEVSTAPQTAPPEEHTPVNLTMGPLLLKGLKVDRQAAVDPAATAVTLYWTLAEPPEEALHIFIRWAGQRPIVAAGTHPASYPIVAWREDEVVTDFHLLPIPSHPPAEMTIEVALGPEFTPINELTWQAISTVNFTGWEDWSRPGVDRSSVRWLFGEVALTGVAFQDQLRPHEPLTIDAAGPGSRAVQFELVPEVIYGQIEIEGQQPRGVYRLEGFVPGATARCGWLRPAAARCVVGEVIVDGIAIPDEAINFGDQIALLGVDIANTELVPGGNLELTAEWLALTPISEDWTVFTQVLDKNDQIVGQIDQFPLQGVRPTSSWQPGEQITDPYRIPIRADAQPGDYRLIIGFYRLSDFQRLPIVDDLGTPIENKQTITGLIIADN